MKHLAGILLACLLSLLAPAQTSTTAYRAETFASAATGAHTPFWTANHNWGMTSLAPNNFYLRAALNHQQTLNPQTSWQAGIDLATGSHSAYGNAWIQQLYAQLNWKIWRIDLGAREDYVSLLDPYLSSGDMSLSNHARPIPELKISLPDFLLIPRTKGRLYFKGDFALGRYFDGEWQKNTALPHLQSYTQDVLSHHKAVYFRLGNIEREKLQFTLGFTHYAQWGGVLNIRHTHYYNPDYPDGTPYYDVTRQPQGFNELLRMMFAQKGSENASDADKTNVAGSHWGTYIANFDYRPAPNHQFQLYYLHFFEDGSSMNPRSFMDMILGIRYKNKAPKLLSAALFEYIYTKNQSGSIHFVLQDPAHAHLRTLETGNDDYYHNVDYIQGPSYYGRSFGTPLFLSPAYNTDGRVHFKNNRILAFHFGFEGYLLPALQYRLLLTSGQGWGRYYRPFLHKQTGFASQLELLYAPPRAAGWQAKASLGYDRGPFFGGNTVGGAISLIRNGGVFGR
jgi:hypothetical protein